MLNPDDCKASFHVRFVQLIMDVAIVDILLYLTFHFFPSHLSKNYSEILFLSLALYFTVIEMVFSRTIGMMIMNSEIIYMPTEERINLKHALIRTFGRLICTCTMGIGYLLELHDYISHTMVVRNNNSNSDIPDWAIFLIKRFRMLKQARLHNGKTGPRSSGSLPILTHNNLFKIAAAQTKSVPAVQQPRVKTKKATLQGRLDD
jgi:hypothetical protein